MKKITNTLCFVALCAGNLSAMHSQLVGNDNYVTNSAMNYAAMEKLQQSCMMHCRHSQKINNQVAQYECEISELKKSIQSKDEEKQQLTLEIEKVSKSQRNAKKSVEVLISHKERLEQESRPNSTIQKMINFIPGLANSNGKFILDTLDNVDRTLAENEDLLQNLTDQQRDLKIQVQIVSSERQALEQRCNELVAYYTELKKAQSGIRESAIWRVLEFFNHDCNKVVELFRDCLKSVCESTGDEGFKSKLIPVLQCVNTISETNVTNLTNSMIETIYNSQIDTPSLIYISDNLPRELIRRLKASAVTIDAGTFKTRKGKYQLSSSIDFIGQVLDNSNPEQSLPCGEGTLWFKYSNGTAFKISTFPSSDECLKLIGVYTDVNELIFTLDVQMNVMVLQGITFASYAKGDNVRVLFGMNNQSRIVLFMSEQGLFIGFALYDTGSVLKDPNKANVNIHQIRQFTTGITGNEFTYSNGDVYLNGGRNFYNVTPSSSYPGETVLALLQRLSSEHESAETQRALPYNPDLSVSDSTGTHVQIDEVSDNESAGHGLEMRQENDEKPVQKKVDNN